MVGWNLVFFFSFFSSIFYSVQPNQFYRNSKCHNIKHLCLKNLFFLLPTLHISILGYITATVSLFNVYDIKEQRQMLLLVIC